MKKLLAVLLMFALGLWVLGITAIAEEEAVEDDPSLEEGYITEGDGWTSEVRWCKNGENNIYGKFYYPEGFDASQVYPALIISHGLNSTSAITERAQWPQTMALNGFVVYSFDFCGGSRNSNSDGDYMKMSVMTEVSDLNAVMDFVREQTFVDTDQLYLLGSSQGGMVSALVAGDRGEEVRAMILIYPGFCIVDDLHKMIDDISAVTGDTVETVMGTLGACYAKDVWDLNVMDEIAGYTGDVLIIHGLNDKTVPLSYSMDAITNAYSESASELLIIGGKKSTHGFEMVYDEGREYAQSASVDFLSKHLKTVAEVAE